MKETLTPEQQSRVKRKERYLQEKGIKIKDYFFSNNDLWVVKDNGEHIQANQL
jgi:hypothetical protein